MYYSRWKACRYRLRGASTRKVNRRERVAGFSSDLRRPVLNVDGVDDVTHRDGLITIAFGAGLVRGVFRRYRAQFHRDRPVQLRAT